MTSKEKLILMYKTLTKSMADELVKEIINKLIYRLKRIKRDSGMMMSPEDGGLRNLWEEICIQLYSGESFYWDLYEDLIVKMIDELIGSYPVDKLRLIWLRTDEGWSWCYDAKHDFDCNEDEEPLELDDWNFPTAFVLNNITDYIFKELIDTASSFSNANIERYIYEFL